MPPRRLGFSLLELMIGIAILGLGMVMVATIFPVAWDRARTLSEYRVQRTVTDNARVTVKALARVSAPAHGPFPADADASSFLGDVLHDRVNNALVTACPNWTHPPVGLSNAADTWIHALNMENIRVANRAFVPERLWAAQDPELRLQGAELNLPPEVVQRSFFRAQIAFQERVYPPVGPRKKVETEDPHTGERLFTGDDNAWDEALATRRYAWAVLHRLNDPLQFLPANPEEMNEAEGNEAKSRRPSFDLYYVILHRSQPTNRYARQDPGLETRAAVSNVCDLMVPPVVPVARPSDEDLMFPVPWRVQVEFPEDPPLVTKVDATGVPTEAQVPPEALSGEDTAKKVMCVQMFPRGAQFIDEITGQVYRVVKRRVTGDEGDQAFLTLDRQVFIEDLDLPLLPDGSSDPRCQPNPVGVLVECELVRTVWVFPPPVQPTTRELGDALIFEGSQPVVGIERRTLNPYPSG